MFPFQIVPKRLQIVYRNPDRQPRKPKLHIAHYPDDSFFILRDDKNYEVWQLYGGKHSQSS
jgi:hypothetical protein